MHSDTFLYNLHSLLYYIKSDHPALIDSVDPLNQEIEALYFQQRDLPHPSKEVHEWANKCTQLTGTIHDFSLYYNKKYLDKWTSENRRHLMNSSIKRYEADLEELRMMKI